MSTVKITKRYRECLIQIGRHFRESDPLHPDSIHRLRVNLKRADSLMALLDWSGSSLGHRHAHALRSYFRLSGKVRALQVEFDSISTYFNDASFNPNYLHQIHEKKIERLDAYGSLLSEGPPKRLVKALQALSRKIKRIDKRTVERYLTHEGKFVSKVLAKNIFREQRLHEVRKRVKRYHLNLVMAGKKSKSLGDLLVLLGRWHDLQIAFDHVVRALYTSGSTPPELEPIRKVKEKLVVDKEAMHEQVVAFYTAGLKRRRKKAVVGAPHGPAGTNGVAIWPAPG